MPDATITPIYLDAALVAKFYLNEPGRDRVRRLTGSAGEAVTSSLAVAEVSAAFHRKYREGAVERNLFRGLQGQFDHDLDKGLWRLVEPTQAVLADVRSLFATLDRSVYLRSLDALHLVTAKSEGFERIYSNDRHLLSAAGKVGLEGVNPI